jgi:hypothetical protein
MKTSPRSIYGMITLLIITLTCSACSSLGGVQAWDKGDLAKAEMRFDKDKLSAKNADHINTSREGSSGGAAVGGGGCGCN